MKAHLFAILLLLLNALAEAATPIALALVEESRLFGAHEPIVCGIGIAVGNITGFYPGTGTKEDDLFGEALILATRYEAMRKVLFDDERRRSVLIIHEAVYECLERELRLDFACVDLKRQGIAVRDDAAATVLYYRFIEADGAWVASA